MSNTIEIYIQKVAKMKTDILIVGSGCSGLYCALNLPREKQITIITKSDVKSSDSYLAQGGICMLKDDSDYDSYFEDTMKAGHYENDRESVSIMIRSSQDVIHDLIGFGVDFAHDENGNLAFTREGAHSDKRILFHEDITGEEITSKLLAAIRKCPNITILENTRMVDIVTKDNCCYGAVIRREDGTIETVEAEHTVWNRRIISSFDQFPSSDRRCPCTFHQTWNPFERCELCTDSSDHILFAGRRGTQFSDFGICPRRRGKAL